MNDFVSECEAEDQGSTSKGNETVRVVQEHDPKQASVEKSGTKPRYHPEDPIKLLRKKEWEERVEQLRHPNKPKTGFPRY